MIDIDHGQGERPLLTPIGRHQPSQLGMQTTTIGNLGQWVQHHLTFQGLVTLEQQLLIAIGDARQLALAPLLALEPPLGGGKIRLHTPLKAI